MVKVILFDFWDTLARIPNLHHLTQEAQSVLGENRYNKLFKQFVEWHIVSKTQDEFLADLDTKISIKTQELQVINNFIAPNQYELYSESKEVLIALRKLGMRLVLVTNSPPTSKVAFENLGIASFFDTAVFSCDVGCMKPDKAIFEYAIKDFSVALGEVLMVGDSLDKDVNGALHAGLRAVLLDRNGLVEYKNKLATLSGLIEMVYDGATE